MFSPGLTLQGGRLRNRFLQQLRIRVVSKNWCDSQFFPSRGVAVVVVDDPTQHGATTHGTGVCVGDLGGWNLLIETLMGARRVEESNVFVHHAT